jgi:hypothetical protein
MSKTKNNRLPRGRWAKGISGNPAGRPAGSLNKSTLYCQEVLQGSREQLMQTLLEMAFDKDATAMRLCMDRMYPAPRERAIDLVIPDVADDQPASTAIASILTAVGEGRITPGEGMTLARILETRTALLDVETLARRVTAIESARSANSEAADEKAERAGIEWISKNYRDARQDSADEDADLQEE